MDMSLNDALYNLCKQINEGTSSITYVETRCREIAVTYNKREDFVRNRMQGLYKSFFCNGIVFRDEHFVNVKNGSHYDYR